MGDKRQRERKTARRERAKRSQRQRRLTADQCANLLWDADAAWNQRDYEHARRLLEKILHIRPNHRTAHERLAELHFTAGRSEAGLTHYDRLSQPPEWPVLTYQAAVANARLARFDRSRSLLDAFLKATSRQPEFKPLRANARALRQEWARLARQHAARAAQSPPRVSTSPDPDGQLELPTVRVAGARPASPPPAAANAEGHAQTGAGHAGTRTDDPAMPSLPAFPDADLPEPPAVVEIDRAGFPETIIATDLAPFGEVLLRHRYAELRLQKGFDELLAPRAARDLVHFRHQLETVRRILRDFRGRVLLADEVGLGKTYRGVSGA